MSVRPDYYDIKMLSNSGLKLFLEYSPFKSQYLYKESIKETPALVLGRAIHKVLLETDEFFDEFAVFPAILKKTTKEGKAFYADLQETGKTILSQKDYETCVGIFDSVNSSENCRNLLKGDAEAEFFGKIDGEELKAKVDLINESKNYVLDVKSCTDASPEAFIKDCMNRKYFMQAYIYTVLTGMQHFIFLAVEKEPPYARSIVIVTDEQMAIGKVMFERALKRYRYACENPLEDYDSKIARVETPKWSLREWDLDR